ncbi:hypothetical protein [Wenzhouxiangella sp. XN24]|nr:hypothetical protein [Wenzhouxiangella sp. XN24]
MHRWAVARRTPGTSTDALSRARNSGMALLAGVLAVVFANLVCG